MGKKILIYDTGQIYETDADQIYLPWFVAGRGSGKSGMVFEKFQEKLKELKEENKNEKGTTSISSG